MSRQKVHILHSGLVDFQRFELVDKRYVECRDSIQRQWPDGALEIHKRTPGKV